MRVISAVAGAILLGAAVAQSDEIEDQIETALGYYRAGDVSGAITELQFTIRAMQAQQAREYETVFPDPPEGWEAKSAETEAGAAFMGGGTILTRTYRSAEGATVSAQLMVDNPMVQTFAALMANPAMLAMQPGAARVKVGRENAILLFDEDAGDGEVTLVMGGRIMLKLEGRRLISSEPLVSLLEAFDFDTLRSIAGLQ